MNKIITININEIDKFTVLNKRSKDVIEINSEVKKIVSNMIKLVKSIDYATGVSAIQLGIPLRIFIVNIDKTLEKEIIAINPRVISISGRIKERMEGCLSLPNFKGPVKRRNKIQFEATNAIGELYRYSASGYEAAVIQHEIDHLNGILFWNRMDNIDKLKKI